jgi:NADH:ubiquinone oxidoreductase subunit K
VIRAINLGVAFLLELAVLFAIGYWGLTMTQGWLVRLLASLGGILLMAVLWGIFASTKASAPLHGVVDVAFRIAWSGVGAIALWAAGLPFAVLALYLVNALMLGTT